MAEVDDKTLAELQGAYKILDAVMRNPKTKDKAHAILKELNPNVSIPEHDIKTGFEDKLLKLQEKIDSFINKQSESKEDENFQKRWSEATSKYGITEDGQKKLHELMTERKIADPEAGALLFNQLNPPQQPVTTAGWESGTLFDPSPETDLGEWFANPEKKRTEEIRKIFAERR